MQIINIEYDNSKSHFLVKDDDDKEYVLSYEQVEELELSEGKEIDFDTYKKLFDYSSYNSNRMLAFKYASKRIISTHQLENYLVRKEVKDEIIYQIISEFVDIGLIDDIAFIKDFIDYKKQINKMSRRMIRYQLKGLGFNDSIIDEHLKSYSDDEEFEIAVELFNFKYHNIPLDDYKDKNKAYHYLYRKGFSSDIINRVFNEVGIE